MKNGVKNAKGNLLRRNSHHLKKSCNEYEEKRDVAYDYGNNVATTSSSTDDTPDTNSTKRQVKRPKRFDDYIMYSRAKVV